MRICRSIQRKHIFLSIIFLVFFTTGCTTSTTEVFPVTITPKEVKPADEDLTSPPPPTLPPSLIPTPPVPQTPLPSSICPQPSGEEASISPISPGTTIIEGFEPQIKNYLNKRGSADGLEEDLKTLTMDDDWKVASKVLSADVTGNGSLEVVSDLVLYFPGQYADGAVFIFQCQGGRYEGGAITTINGMVMSSADPDPGGIRTLQDMNGDSIPDIIISYIEIIGTHANYTRVFKIFTWDGANFVSLLPKDEYGSSAIRVQNGDGEVVDLEADGVYEIVLTHGVGAGPEADPLEKPRTEIWAWNGSVFTLAHTEETAPAIACTEIEGEPIYRFQAFQYGDIATVCGDYDEALAYYQQAVFDEELLGWSQGRKADDAFYTVTPTPDPDERPRISAYGRYRIMLLHVAQGYILEAEIVYDTLVEKFPNGAMGSEYAMLATIFWNAYQESEDIGAACTKVASYAAVNVYQILEPLSSDFYGSDSQDYGPYDVCPFK